MSASYFHSRTESHLEALKKIDNLRARIKARSNPIEVIETARDEMQRLREERAERNYKKYLMRAKGISKVRKILRRLKGI